MYIPYVPILAYLYIPQFIRLKQENVCAPLGTEHVSKSDEFSEKFQTAFDPPLIFGKLYCGFRDKIATKVRMFIWRNFCVFYDPISYEMHVAPVSYTHLTLPTILLV